MEIRKKVVRKRGVVLQAEGRTSAPPRLTSSPPDARVIKQLHGGTSVRAQHMEKLQCVTSSVWHSPAATVSLLTSDFINVVHKSMLVYQINNRKFGVAALY